MYTTKEIAREFDIHENTIRYYEKKNFLSLVERRKNGYRIFSKIHFNQISIIRLIYLDEWPGKRIRLSSDRILNNLHDWDLVHLTYLTNEYINTIKSEIKNVGKALKFDSNINLESEDSEILDYKKAANRIGVTKDTLRNWERNGFFTSIRGERNTKHIDMNILRELERIYALRMAGFSMSFIYKFQKSPDDLQQLEIHSAGDHLIDFLNTTLEKAKKIKEFLKK